MASWFLLTISAIVMIGAVMFAGASLVSALTDAPAHAEALRRLNTLSDLIIANSWQGLDGQIYLPAPSPGPPGPIEGIGTVPSWLRARTAFPQGQMPIYCPFGPSTGSPSSDVWNPDGTRYSVDLTTVMNRSYVISGRPSYADATSNVNLAGFVMIPETPGGSYAGCNQITGSAGSYSAPGMLVRAILFDRPGSIRTAGKALPRILYANTNGTGSGSHASDPISLSSALSLWRSNPWANTRIELIATGSYSLSATALSASATDYVEHPARSQLAIVGLGRSSTTLTLTSSGQIDLPVSLDISGVTIASTNLTIVNRGALLQTRNATLGPIEVAETGTALIWNSNVSSSVASRPTINLLSGGRAVLLGNANLTVIGGTRLADVASEADLEFVSATSTFTVSTAPSILVATGGNLTINNSTLSLSQSSSLSFRIFGNAVVANSTLAHGGSVAYTTFDLRAGSSLNFNSSNITGNGTLGTAYSITSSGARSISGSNSTILGCWADTGGAPVFGYSATVGTGSSSSVTASEPVPPITDTSTAAEISSYLAAMSRNTGRISARVRNTSDWTCSLAAPVDLGGGGCSGPMCSIA